MKRLFGIGLLGLLACGGADEPDLSQTCPGATATAAPARRVPSSKATLADGREAVIVHLKPGTTSAQALRGRGRVHKRWSALNAYATQVTPAERASLAKDPAVAHVEPDKVVRALGVTALAAPVSSGSVLEYTPGLKMVQAPEVWDANLDGVLDVGAHDGTGARVCIIDSGLDRRHPELKIPVVGGYDFVDGDEDYSDQSGGEWGGGHGTHVAGTIAAQLASGGDVGRGLNPGGVVGVAPGASLLIARVLDLEGSGNVSTVVDAVGWCVSQGADIISLSLGSEDPSVAEEEAFALARQAGVLTIAATGNSGADEPMGYPAGYPGVLAVGAVDDTRELAGFSQTGFELGVHEGLTAPGVGVLSTFIVGGSAEAYFQLGDAAVQEAATVEYSTRADHAGPLVDCGLGGSETSCKSVKCKGFVAYVERGGTLETRDENGELQGITFAMKVSNAIAQGAGAVIIGNNVPEEGPGSFTLGADAVEWPARVPVISLDTATGTALRDGHLGESVRLSFTESDYAVQSGTCMATPHVSGVAALVLSARPELTGCQLREVLYGGAADLGLPGFDSEYGHGLVQAKASLTVPAPENCE